MEKVLLSITLILASPIDTIKFVPGELDGSQVIQVPIVNGKQPTEIDTYRENNVLLKLTFRFTKDSQDYNPAIKVLSYSKGKAIGITDSQQTSEKQTFLNK